MQVLLCSKQMVMQWPAFCAFYQDEKKQEAEGTQTDGSAPSDCVGGDNKMKEDVSDSAPSDCVGGDNKMKEDGSGAPLRPTAAKSKAAPKNQKLRKDVDPVKPKKRMKLFPKNMTLLQVEKSLHSVKPSGL